MYCSLSISENTHIVQSDTPFTYQSTLEIYNIQESNAENYTCAGECIISNDSSTFFIMKNIRHELIVHGNYDIFIYLTKNIFFIIHIL